MKKTEFFHEKFPELRLGVLQGAGVGRGRGAGGGGGGRGGVVGITWVTIVKN